MPSPKGQSLGLPILIGVSSIIFAIAILVGWSVLFTNYYSLATRTKQVSDLGAGYWLLLAIGCLFLMTIVATLVLLLIGNIKKILYVRQQDIFIDGVTHEFKSPLASLRLCLETMEMRELSPSMQHRFVEMMKKDVDRLGAFVEHLLEAGRIEHGGRILREETFDLLGLLEQTKRQILERYNLLPEQIDVRLPLQPCPFLLHHDRLALETVILNLLDNAVKYSEAPVQIDVSLGVEEGRFSLAFRDHGIGIAPRHLKKVFQRFYRIRREGRVMPRGTGLGLYVVASLVRRLGGRIHAESPGEGQGSTFLVEFPWHPPAPLLSGEQAEPLFRGEPR